MYLGRRVVVFLCASAGTVALDFTSPSMPSTRSSLPRNTSGQVDGPQASDKAVDQDGCTLCSWLPVFTSSIDNCKAGEDEKNAISNMFTTNAAYAKVAF